MKRPWLTPFVPLYAAGVALRDMRLKNGWEPIRRLRFPVISIGNLSTGGSGKTPFAIALAKLLTKRGFQVDVLSRGYGRQNTEPLRVCADGADEEFGDEPLLIAQQAGVPVYVAPQRFDAGLLAEVDLQAQRRDAGADNCPAAHILDDGFQHRQLARDIDILLLSRADLHDCLLPAGNLREPLAALRRAHVIAIPADEPELCSDLKAWGWQGPIWRLHRRMDVPKVTSPVAAFCGIARPEQFFAGLEGAGLRLSSSIVFRDHHRYTARDVKRLDSAAQFSDVTAILTTEKDKVRMGVLRTCRPLLAVGLRTEVEDESDALEWLTARLATAPANAPL